MKVLVAPSLENREVTSRTCSVPGCDRTGYLTRGWCHTHYERWRLKGTTDDPPTRRKPCSIEGCPKPHASRGYCQTHYSVFVRASKRSRVCQAEGCDRFSDVAGSARGLCPLHYQRWKVTDAALTTQPSCKVSGCGKPVVGRRMCSRHYRRWHRGQHPEMYADKDHRRRARVLEAECEDVERLVVFERDDWTCQLCSGRIDQTRRWPDPLSASLDHRLPLARGGAHSYANTQAAHLGCNIRKGARVA